MNNIDVFCCYCGRAKRSHIAFNKEHLVPRSKGGNDTPRNKKDCCVTCNSWRGNKPLKKWRKEIELLLACRNATYQHKGDILYRVDLQAMVENITSWMEYIETASFKLY